MIGVMYANPAGRLGLTRSLVQPKEEQERSERTQEVGGQKETEAAIQV